MNFLEKAQQLGLDVNALKNGQTIQSTHTVNSLEEFKQLFAGNLSPEQRSNFAKGAPVAVDTASANMNNLMHNVYGTHELSAADQAFANQVFPAKVNLTAVQDLTITQDMVYGPAGPPEAILAGTITFDGGSITANSTVFTLQADNVVVRSQGTKPYTVGLVGNKGQDGYVGSTGTPYTSAASNGSNASAPSPGICTGASSGGNGSDGSQGNEGGRGGDGYNGQPNLPANITVNNFDSSSAQPFVVYTVSGAGGDGGKGGQGGQGQNGGNGGNGCDSGCEGTDGGNGGKAGQGGNGGPGGNGGQAVNGNAINISFPSSSKASLVTTSDTANPGAKGQGGSPGQAGNYGNAGSGGKHSSSGQHGSGNTSGNNGPDGQAGTQSGTPGAFNVQYT